MKRNWLPLVLSCAVIMTGHGVWVNAEEQTQTGTSAEDSLSEDLPEDEEDPELPVSDAVVTGRLLASLDDCYGIADAAGEQGWALLVYAGGKGYGSPWCAVGPVGQIIWGEEGAEVYLCQDGILQMEWRDAQNGEWVSAGSLFSGYYDDAPSSAKLYACSYDWEGEKTEEQEIASYEASTGGDYYSDIYSTVEGIASGKGADIYSYGTRLETVDDNGDAVVYAADGSELIRYPDTEASDVTVTISDNMLSVYLSADYKTEVFWLGEHPAEEPQTESE